MNKKYNHIDIEYAIEVLNSPQLSLGEDFREWISDKDNLELYKELRKYREAGFIAENYKRPDVDKQWNKERDRLKDYLFYGGLLLHPLFLYYRLLIYFMLKVFWIS